MINIKHIIHSYGVREGPVVHASKITSSYTIGCEERSQDAKNADIFENSKICLSVDESSILLLIRVTKTWSACPPSVEMWSLL